MENNPSYRGELHIDTVTTRLILDLLDSIRSSVPVEIPPEPDGPGKLNDDPDLARLKNILVVARKHSAELEGVFDPDVLLRYIRYASDYQKILTRVEKLLDEIKHCRERAFKFAEELAAILVEHLQMTGALHLLMEDDASADNIPLPNKGIRLKVV
jgi:hypothetical protein